MNLNQKNNRIMKKWNLAIGLLAGSLFAVMLFYSCSENNQSENIEPIANDKYYVKYVIQGTGSYGRFSNWTATTPNGLYSNRGFQVRNWEKVYGPLNSGFKCEVIIENYIWKEPSISIYISKNDEPFDLKESVSGKTATYRLIY